MAKPAPTSAKPPPPARAARFCACTIVLACAFVLAGTPAVQASTAGFEGDVVARHSDNFGDSSSHVSYLLDRDQGATLRLAGSRSQLAALVPGEHVQVTGDLRGQTVHLDGAPDSGGDSSQRAVAAAPSSQKVAVILLNFTNDRSQPWTPADLQNTVFTAPDSVNGYFQEESTGAIELTGKNSVNGDVLGWYEINSSNANCDYSAWEAAAATQAALNGDDLSGYDNYVYVWPDATSCDWAGLAYLPGSSAYINGSPTLRVISHELSHNFGIHHASSYRCTSGGQRVFISSSCTASEYGDPFSVMGGSASNHANAWHKAQLGFLPSASIQTVTSSGDYALTPSEQDLAGQTQLLRVPRKLTAGGAVSDYYYVEFRQPFGTYFDAFNPADPVVNGVSVRVAGNLSSLTQSKLLDANPQTTTFGDAPIAVGQSGTDSSVGVTIETLSVAPGGANVRIDVAPPVQSTPTAPVDQAPADNAVPAVTPRLSYVARANRRVLKTRRLVVSAGCDRACALTASATVRAAKGRAKLRPARGSAQPDSLVRLRLVLPRSALKIVRSAFHAKRKATITLKLVATGESGESTSMHKRITVRP